MQDCASKLQIRFLKKRFLRQFNSSKDIFKKITSFKPPNDNTNKDKMFGDLTSYVSKTEVVKAVSQMLTRYYRWISRNSDDYYRTIAPALDAKKFLTSFLISYFPEFILSSDQGIDRDIYILAKDLCESFMVASNNLPKFVRSVNNFSNAFGLFIEQDRLKQINHLIWRWNDLDRTKSGVVSSSKYATSQKADVIEHLNSQQEKVIRLIKGFDKDFNINILKEFSSLYDRMTQGMEKCYWDMLEQDIMQRENKILARSLEEIKLELISLHRKSKNDLDEYFDVDFIIQKLDNNVLYFDDFMALADYIIEKIVFLQAPIRNDGTREKWKIVRQESYNKINGVTQEEYAKIYAKCATEAIKFILREIQCIKNDILNLQVDIKKYSHHSYSDSMLG